MDENPREKLMDTLKFLRDFHNNDEKFVYRGWSQFLIGHGQWYEAVPFPDGVKRGVEKTCYANALDAGYPIEVAQQQLRHSDSRTTLRYTHSRSGVTEQAMADVSNSLKLDAVGRGVNKGNQYIQ